MLNHTALALHPVLITVEENEWLEETKETFPGFGPHSMTKVGVNLIPKDSWPEADVEIPIRVVVSAPGLSYSYAFEHTLTSRSNESSGPFRRTFWSPMDQSVQFFGEMAPTFVETGEEYALALSLHGASVDAKNQAGSYSPKDWIFHIAATNRRPFGFDWQAWGRRDAIEVLDYVLENYPIDPTRVHLTGHSMGGHGTWHVGTLFSHRFATFRAQCGMDQFRNLWRKSTSERAFGSTQLHFDPRVFKTNLTGKGVYIIHGTADDNVPIWHGETMFAELEGVVENLSFHKEEGAGHWWDGDTGAGVDCVDWPPLFDLMSQSTVDPLPLDFNYVAPAPWVNDSISFLRYDAFEDPNSLGSVQSTLENGTLQVITENIASLSIDTGLLTDTEAKSLVVNGSELPLDGTTQSWGNPTGKTSNSHGPFNQVFHRPFCLVYSEETPVFAEYAAYLSANWAIVGNGSSCILPFSAVTEEELRDQRNLVYVELPSRS